MFFCFRSRRAQPRRPPAIGPARAPRTRQDAFPQPVRGGPRRRGRPQPPQLGRSTRALLQKKSHSFSSLTRVDAHLLQLVDGVHVILAQGRAVRGGGGLRVQGGGGGGGGVEAGGVGGRKRGDGEKGARSSASTFLLCAARPGHARPRAPAHPPRLAPCLTTHAGSAASGARATSSASAAILFGERGRGEGWFPQKGVCSLSVSLTPPAPPPRSPPCPPPPPPPPWPPQSG